MRASQTVTIVVGVLALAVNASSPADAHDLQDRCDEPDDENGDDVSMLQLQSGVKKTRSAAFRCRSRPSTQEALVERGEALQRRVDSNE